MNHLSYELYAQNGKEIALAVRQYAVKKVILRMAEKAGIAADMAQVDRRMEELETSPGFCEALEAAGMDIESLRSEIKIEQTVEAWLEHVSTVSCGQAEETYDANPTLWTTREKARFRHILITINEAFPENRREEAGRRIGALKNSSDDFAALAMRHSECPSALNGGEIGPITRDQIHPALADAVFAMEPMGAPVIVETEAGFHLAQLLEVRPGEAVEREKGVASTKRALSGAKRRRALANALKQAMRGIIMAEPEDVIA